MIGVIFFYYRRMMESFATEMNQSFTIYTIIIAIINDNEITKTKSCQ